jgi:hypothetical protein
VWQARTPDEADIYRPGRNEAVVMSNSRYGLDLARCV